MTTQYTPTLKLALPVQGELSGSWGDVVNDNITSMVEQAVTGLATIDSWTANSHTLTTANGTTSEARCAILELTDTGTALTGAGTVICPDASKLYTVRNSTGQIITLKTASGSGIAIPDGHTAFLYCDATNVVESITSFAGDATFAGDITGLTLNATGGTSAGDNAAMGYDSFYGAMITGQGSTYDTAIFNDANTAVMGVLTGTQDVRFWGRTLSADGSAASPSMTFRDDVDTGIWRRTANTICISTGGVQRLEIDSAGTSIFSGDVTVDTGANGASFTIHSPSQVWAGGEDLGGIDWYTEDTSGSGPAVFASLHVESTGSNTLPISNLVFKASNANATPVEVLRIGGTGDATFAGDINFSGSQPDVLLNADNDRLVVSGGDATNSGANIIFYGATHASNANKMIFRNSGTTALTINASQDATFAGNVTATSNITAYSDRKLKDNLEVIPNALGKVSQLTGYTYDRIDMDGVRQSGLIAQDVQEVLPEVIVSNVDPDSGEETLSLAYGNMIGLLVEAVKELKAEVEELKGNK